MAQDQQNMGIAWEDVENLAEESINVEKLCCLMCGRHVEKLSKSKQVKID